MSGIAATSPTTARCSGQRARGHDWRTLRLTTIYVAVIATLVAVLLAAGVALAPASPAPEEMRLLQPAAGAQTTLQIG